MVRPMSRVYKWPREIGTICSFVVFSLVIFLSHLANLPMGNIGQMCSKNQHWQNPAETELRFQGKFSELEPKTTAKLGKKKPNRANFNSSVAKKCGKTSNVGLFGPQCAICACLGEPGRKRRRFQGKFFALEPKTTLKPGNTTLKGQIAPISRVYRGSCSGVRGCLRLG